MKKAGDNLVASTRNIFWHVVVSVKETADEYEVKDIISSSGVCNMRQLSSHQGFADEFQEMRTDSLGGPADHRSVKFFFSQLRFSMGGCSIFRRLDELRDPKFV